MMFGCRSRATDSASTRNRARKSGRIPPDSLPGSSSRRPGGPIPGAVPCRRPPSRPRRATRGCHSRRPPALPRVLGAIDPRAALEPPFPPDRCARGRLPMWYRSGPRRPYPRLGPGRRPPRSRGSITRSRSTSLAGSTASPSSSVDPKSVVVAGPIADPTSSVPVPSAAREPSAYGVPGIDPSPGTGRPRVSRSSRPWQSGQPSTCRTIRASSCPPSSPSRNRRSSALSGQLLMMGIPGAPAPARSEMGSMGLHPRY